MKSLRMVLGLTALALASCSGVLGDLLTSVREVELPKQVFMEIADQETLSPVITPADATNQRVQWTSDNPGVVQVSASGQLFPVAEGVATVQVTTEDGQKVARTQVTITDKTWVTGTVYAPNGVDPIPHALVWAPLGPVAALSPTVTQFSSSNYPGPQARTSTYTDAQGKFTLRKMPSGTNIPLVVQLGKWRRQVTLPSVAYRSSTPIPTSLLRLPKNKAEGDLPKIAVVTGQIDNPENLLRRLGIEDSEFSNPSGSARVHFYKNRTGPGATINAQTPVDTTLWASQNLVNSYDIIIIACNAYATVVTPQEKTVFNNFLAAGGRVYTGHYGSVWMKNNSIFTPAFNWVQGTSLGNITANILQTTARGKALFQWINSVTSPAPQGNIPLQNLRKDFTPMTTDVEILVQFPAPMNSPGVFTYGPPIPTSPKVSGGRVNFVDFETGVATNGKLFPAECSAIGTPISLQERLGMGLMLQLMDPFGPQ